MTTMNIIMRPGCMEIKYIHKMTGKCKQKNCPSKPKYVAIEMHPGWNVIEQALEACELHAMKYKKHEVTARCKEISYHWHTIRIVGIPMLWQ